MSLDWALGFISFDGLETLHQLPQIQLVRLQQIDVSSIGEVCNELIPNKYICAGTRQKCLFLFRLLSLAAATWPSKEDITLLEAVDDCIKVCALPTSYWWTSTNIKLARTMLIMKVLPVFLCLLEMLSAPSSVTEPDSTLTELGSMSISPPSADSSPWTRLDHSLRSAVTALMAKGAKLVWCTVPPTSGSPSTGPPSNEPAFHYAVRAFAEAESQLVQMRNDAKYRTLQIHFIDNNATSSIIAEPKFGLYFRASSLGDAFASKLQKLVLEHGASSCWMKAWPRRDQDCRIRLSLKGETTKEEFEQSVRNFLKPDERDIISFFYYPDTPDRLSDVRLDCGVAGTPWSSILSQLDIEQVDKTTQVAQLSLERNTEPRGSIGAFLMDEHKKSYALTAAHVFLKLDDISSFEGASQMKSEFPSCVWNGKYDLALVPLKPCKHELHFEDNGLCSPQTDSTAQFTGPECFVMKRGMKTGVTFGTPAGLLSFDIGGTQYVSQFVVDWLDATPFAAPGDSGSVYFMVAPNRTTPGEPVAIHRGSAKLGDKLISFGTPWKQAMIKLQKRLGLTSLRLSISPNALDEAERMKLLPYTATPTSQPASVSSTPTPATLAGYGDTLPDWLESGDIFASGVGFGE